MSRIVSILAASLLLVATVATGAAEANAPLAKGQAPGWYRMMLGDFEITALYDGPLSLPTDQILTNTTPAKVRAALARSFLAPPVESSVNCFLVNTGSKLVLIDAGAGTLFGPGLGRMVANLKASGYQPEQVDEIYITHMHPDHVGDLVMGGKVTFPKAIVRAAKAEGEQWLSQANMDKAPDAAKDFFKGAMSSLNPYLAAGKYNPFEGKTELVPGIIALPATGHTDGHTLYVVESKGQKLVVWGDLIHVAAVQFEDPSVTIQFDTNAKKAAAERKKVFAEAVKEGYLAAATHLSFPGIGHLRKDGRGYRWLPVEYTANNPR